MEEVAVRTGLAVSQLEALESGALPHIPDRVVILKTLRRYADALGLPGDRLVLALIDLWPSPGPGGVSSVAVPEAAMAGSFGTTSVGGLSAGNDPLVEGAATASLYAEFDTAAVPQVYEEDDPTASHPAGPPPISGAFMDTGVTTAVGRPDRSRSPRPKRAPLALRLLVAVVGIAVVLGTVGLIAYEVRPSWFHQLGFGQSTTATTSAAPRPSSPATTAPTKPTTTHRSGVGAKTPTASALTVASSASDSATVTVRGVNPTVRVEASGGDCWVSVTSSQQSNPVFANVMSDGSHQDFPLGQSLVVQLGSGAGKAEVLQGSKVIGTYTPPNAPFTVTFTPA